MASWAMQSWSRAGSYLGTLPFRDLQGEFWYNQPKQIRFTLPLYHDVITRAIVDPGNTEIRLYRNGVLTYAGVLWNATGSSDSKALSCDSEDLSSYLGLRRCDTDLRYVNQAGSAIMWDLINRAQTGTDAALGLIQGTVNTAPTRTQQSYLASDMKDYLTMVTDLANDSNGFDWEIAADRKLNLYYPRLQTPARVKLEWGGAINRYSVQVQGKWEANDIAVSSELFRGSAIDTTKRAYYGLRQLGIENRDLTTAAQTNNLATRYLSLHRDPKETPSVTLRATVNPFDGDIWMGQVAQVVIDDGWTQYNEQMRCDGFQFTIGKHGQESFNLYMTDLREVT